MKWLHVRHFSDPYADQPTLTKRQKSARSRLRIKNLFPKKYVDTNKKSCVRVKNWRRDTYGISFKTRNARGVQRTKVRITSRGLMFEHDVSEPADPPPKAEVKEETPELQQSDGNAPGRVIGTITRVRCSLHLSSACCYENTQVTLPNNGSQKKLRTQLTQVIKTEPADDGPDQADRIGVQQLPQPDLSGGLRSLHQRVARQRAAAASCQSHR